jgi:LmbE family N-acetylglucosaminyl deacetylase
MPSHDARLPGHGRSRWQTGPVAPRTIVAVHAHPDDEALLSAGTLATLASAGHRVVLVLATQGEVGAVGHHVLADDEGLGPRRAAEARASADAIGAQRLVFLGFGDSGSEPPGPGGWPAGSLCAAPLDQVVDRLAEVLDEERPDLVIADDSNGGYGHPDHVRVHEATSLATARCGVPMAQVTIDRDVLAGGIALAQGMGITVPEGFVPPDVSAWYTAGGDITHAVDVGAALGAKRASMEAHASQATGAPDTVRTLAVFLGLPDDLFALAFGTEWFVWPGRPTSPRGTDLLADLPTAAP